MPPNPARLKKKLEKEAQEAESESLLGGGDRESEIDFGEEIVNEEGCAEDGHDCIGEWTQDEAGEAKRHAYQAVQHLALRAMQDEKLYDAERSQLAKGQKIATE